MDTKRRIEVTINGQTHIFVTSDSEEYIKGLAEYLNEKISEVTGSSFGNLLPNDKKYIVAAMNILDDYYKVLSKFEKINEKKEADTGKNQDIIQTYENKIQNYVSQITALQKENAKLSESLESARYELEYVQNLYKEQKQEYEQLLESATKPEGK